MHVAKIDLGHFWKTVLRKENAGSSVWIAVPFKLSRAYGSSAYHPETSDFGLV